MNDTTTPLPPELSAFIEGMCAGDPDGEAKREIIEPIIGQFFGVMREVADAARAHEREESAKTMADLAEALRVEMERAAKERDEACATPGAARAESRAEGRRAGLAFALDLVRSILPAGGAS